MKLVLDLCAGLGGFSQAFREREDWQVVTVDIEEKFNPTMQLDLIDVVENPDKYPEFWKLKPDVILASPPCQRFSIASSTWPLPGMYTALRVVGAVMEIITILQPKQWLLIRKNSNVEIRPEIGWFHCPITKPV